jgi:hypothetical protein
MGWLAIFSAMEVELGRLLAAAEHGRSFDDGKNPESRDTEMIERPSRRREDDSPFRGLINNSCGPRKGG